MFLGKTKDTWKKELFDLFFACLCITVLVASAAILTYGISMATGQRLRDAFETLGKIGLVILAGHSAWRFLLNRMKRRVKLLDLGRFFPTRGWYLIWLASLAIVGIGNPQLAPFLGCAFVSFSAFWFERLLFVEDGIGIYGSFLKWQDIESYEWRNDSTLVLKSQPKSRLLGFPYENKHALSIPAGQREAVSQLLEQYACKQTTPI